jgi:predicted DNA-binding transcriptional regulator AlpA
MVGKEKTRLIGIKAVADYLNTSERNIYRWEKELGLPLRRVAGSKGRSVYVDVHELEKWLVNKHSLSLIDKKHLLKILTKTSLLFIAIISIALVIFLSLGKKNRSEINPSTNNQRLFNPASFSLEGGVVYIKNRSGETIWTYTADDKKETLFIHKTVDFSDIDNDSMNEVLARTYNSKNDTFYLTLFDHDGSILWERSISNDQIFNGIKTESDFFPLNVKFVHTGKKVMPPCSNSIRHFKKIRKLIYPSRNF